ncbi:MAG: V-type ATPase 116kDa subunit family protein, partial [Candidatus Thorarchaeota archaeon]
ILFFTFPLIFGLIFADVGQGFLILLIGLAAWRAKRKGANWGDMLGYLQTGAEGLVMMGLCAMMGGFLFGSFFGSHTVIEPLWPIFAQTLENGDPNPWRQAHMLKLSIEIGAIQISLGIVLNLYKRLQHGDFRRALVPLSYLWLYLGFVNLLLSVSYNDINLWFSSTGQVNLWIPFIGIGLGSGNNGVYPPLPITPMMFTLVALFLPLIIMGVTSLLSGVDGLVEFMEYSLGMVSHTVSYARIFALNTVHVILSGVFFNLLPGIIDIPFPALSIFGIVIIPEFFMHDGHSVAPHLPLLGAIVGTVIVGMLEGLLAFMHTLRLHYVEWFSKFYHGDGIPFKPFVTKRIHTVSITSGSAQSN